MLGHLTDLDNRIGNIIFHVMLTLVYGICSEPIEMDMAMEITGLTSEEIRSCSEVIDIEEEDSFDFE